MKIILTEDVKGHGKKGAIIEVKDGFGKNYLIKNGLGRTVDNAILSNVQAREKSQDFHKQQEINQIKETIVQLQSTTVTVNCKVGAGGKMFGGITGAEIAGLLKSEGFDIDKKSLVFDAIKEIGEYKIKYKFNHGLIGQFTLKVMEGK